MAKKEFQESRRKFIKQVSLASIGLTTPFSSIVNLKTMNALASSMPPPTNGYKAMVCFFLQGGNDSYNMLIPKSNTEYNHYATTRSNLAIPQSNLLSLNNTGGNFGVHPSLSGIQPLFDAGDVAFIANAGTLVEPTTKTQYQNGSANLPLGLFSHLDQYNHWQSGRPNVRTNKGWGGRIADLLSSVNTNNNISMNLSLSGANIFQYGQNSVEFSLNYNGALMPTNRNASWGDNPERKAATDSILNYAYSDQFHKTYADIFRGSIEAGEEFQNAIDAVPDFNTTFSNERTSKEFKMIAKTIAARTTLGFDRQIFFVRLGGWDHHDELILNQAEKLQVVNDALVSFKGALDEMGVFNEVTTFVVSEFARTLTSNGNGSDHAWGGNMMVMGGSVNGGTIYGTYPSLEINSGQYINGGVMVPTTATDSIFAELALWYGISPSDLTTVLPNLGNFHNVSGLSTTTPPIGFMNM